MQFDMNFFPYYDQQKRKQLRLTKFVENPSANIPVTAAAPANIAEGGGAKSKPLTLLL